MCGCFHFTNSIYQPVKCFPEGKDNLELRNGMLSSEWFNSSRHSMKTKQNRMMQLLSYDLMTFCLRSMIWTSSELKDMRLPWYHIMVIYNVWGLYTYLSLYAFSQLEEMLQNENKVLFTFLCTDFRFWTVKNPKMICLFLFQKHACARTQTSTVTVLGVVFLWHGHVMVRKTVLMVQMKAQKWSVWKGIPHCAHQTSSVVQTISALMRYVQQNKINLEF
jgi:hypothetical protein